MRYDLQLDPEQKSQESQSDIISHFHFAFAAHICRVLQFETGFFIFLATLLLATELFTTIDKKETGNELCNRLRHMATTGRFLAFYHNRFDHKFCKQMVSIFPKKAA